MGTSLIPHGPRLAHRQVPLHGGAKQVALAALAALAARPGIPVRAVARARVLGGGDHLMSAQSTHRLHQNTVPKEHSAEIGSHLFMTQWQTVARAAATSRDRRAPTEPRRAHVLPPLMRPARGVAECLIDAIAWPAEVIGFYRFCMYLARPMPP